MTSLGEVIAVVDLVRVLVTRAAALVESAELLWTEAADHLAVGIRDRRGALAWYDEENEFVPINGTNPTHADYFTWDAHHFSFPPSCEVPIELVHEAVREYWRAARVRRVAAELRLREAGMTASLLLEDEWIVLANVGDVDELIAALAAKENFESGAGRMWSVRIAEDVEVPSLVFGLRGDRGGLLWCEQDDGYVPANGTNSDWADYFSWPGDHFSMPPGSEIPVALAYAALREFALTGARPTCVEWRLDES